MHGMHQTDLQNFNNEQKLQKLNKISCIEKGFFRSDGQQNCSEVKVLSHFALVGP